MIKDTVIKLYKNQPVNDLEMNELLVDYIVKEKGKEPTKSELDQIRNLVYSRIFGLEQLLAKYKKELKLQVETLVNLKTNSIIKTNVYE